MAKTTSRIYSAITRLIGEGIADVFLCDLRSYRDWTGAQWELTIEPASSGMAGETELWTRKGEPS